MVWAHFFGQGIINEVDDVRISNPASNQELLDDAGQEVHRVQVRLQEAGEATSARAPTYQRSARSRRRRTPGTPETSPVPPIRRIRAETLLDCITQVTGSEGQVLRGCRRGRGPCRSRTGSTSTYFLSTFGRATRESVCSCEVRLEPTLSQSLHLLNGDTVGPKVAAGRADRPKMLQEKKTNGRRSSRQIYLRSLSRGPPRMRSGDEETGPQPWTPPAGREDPRVALEDVFWAVHELAGVHVQPLTESQPDPHRLPTRLFDMNRLTTFAWVAVVATVGLRPPLARADAQKPTFDDDIKPMLAQHCGSCHSNDKQKGGLNLATFAATMTGGSSGVVVAAGDPAKSRLYTLSAHTEEPKMPPNGAKMEQPKLDLLKKWVEQGARENAGSKVVAMKPKTDIGLASVTRGRPAGPPPMPGKLPTDPLTKARRPGAVLALAASPWAPVIAVGGQKQVFLIHADTGDPLGTLAFPHGQVNSLKFSRSGKLLLAAGGRGGQSGKATLFDLATGKVVTEVGIESDAILAADISADQTQIAVGSPSKLIRVYSTADGSVIREIKKHTDWVTAVEYSADGVLLATGDRNGGLFVWEAFTGREYFSLRGHTAMITDISWRDDSNVLATSSEDTTIRLWEMENGNPIKNWGAHGGGAASVRFTHDNRLVSTGRDRLTKVWDQNGAAQKQFDPLPDLGLRAAVTYDAAAVFAGDWSGTVKGWTLADAKVRVAADTNPPTAAERLALLEKAVVAAEAKLKQATDAAAVAKANADKANAELVPVQKLVGDTTNAANAAKAAVAPAKTELDQASATLAATQAPRRRRPSPCKP